MTIDALLTFALAVGALAIKPGAGMAMCMSRSISGGWSSCLIFVLGFCIISIAFLLFVVLGYQYLEVDLIFISIFIKALAAVYLIWMGIKGLQNTDEGLTLSEGAPETLFDSLSASIMLTLSNPLTIVFYAGILPTLINVEAITAHDVLLLCMVIVVVEYAVAIMYCSPLILFRKKMKQKFIKQLNIFASIMIILVGLYIGYTAVPAADIMSVF